MRAIISKARYLLCCLIILAFFIPSYQNISGFSFIPLAFSAVEGQSEISSIDVFIAVVPLVLIPVSALAILVRTSLRKTTRKTIKALPLICLFIFTVILFMSLRSISGGGRSSLRILSHMQGGYYVVAVASLLLPFTKAPYKRRSKKQQATAVQVPL
jgi:uncharacterized membrane protein YhaH (DUF805 family)